MGGRGSGGGGGKGGGGGGGAAPAPAAPAEFNADTVARSLVGPVDIFTTPTASLRDAAPRHAAAEAQIRQTLSGLSLGQLRQVASQYTMRPPGGMTAAQMTDWMVGTWKGSRGYG